MIDVYNNIEIKTKTKKLSPEGNCDMSKPLNLKFIHL